MNTLNPELTEYRVLLSHEFKRYASNVYESFQELKSPDTQAIRVPEEAQARRKVPCGDEPSEQGVPSERLTRDLSEFRWRLNELCSSPLGGAEAFVTTLIEFQSHP